MRALGVGLLILITACGEGSQRLLDAGLHDQAGPDGTAQDVASPDTAPSETSMADVVVTDAPLPAQPVFAPAAGTYAYRQAITLTAADADAVIYYTLDGSAPDASKLRYDAPIRLTTRLSGATIRAVAQRPGAGPSALAEARYDLQPGMVIHFKKPAAWSSPTIHYWETQPGGLATTWPGAAMADEGNGWYVIQLADQTSAKVVFSDNGQPQTEDLAPPWGEAWYDDGDWYPVHPDHFKRFTWPQGKTKALVMSFDDGNTQDRQLVALFDQYGIRGTFHLNSGRLDTNSYVTSAEVPTLYAGHEVSAHTVSHPELPPLTTNEIEHEIADDKSALEALVGKPVTGMAYPFGHYDERVLEVLRQQNMIYARVVPQTGDLRIPGYLLTWRGSCHHTCAYPLGEALNAWSAPYMGLLFIWGHAWELDGGQPQNSWSDMESFCQLVGGKSDIWYATAGEVAKYLLALRAVEIALHGDRATNTSADPVWIITSHGVVALQPGESTAL